MSGVLSALKPTINYAISNVGGGADPLLQSKAKLYAAQAVKKYNPEGGSGLHTWVSNQLMQLKRYKRQTQAAIRVPDRTQIDAYAIARAENEFTDKHGRAPNVDELSDHVKMPVKRITKVKTSFRKVTGESTFANGMVGDVDMPDYSPDAVDYIYKDADYIDKKIIELKTGYGGNNEPMAPSKIAAMLKLTPSQLTRRSAKIALQMQEIEDALRTV